MDLSYMAFVMLRYIPSIPTLLRYIVVSEKSKREGGR